MLFKVKYSYGSDVSAACGAGSGIYRTEYLRLRW